MGPPAASQTSHRARPQTDSRRFLLRGDMDELYDLKDDPFEMTNLIGDSAHADVLARTGQLPYHVRERPEPPCQ